MRPIPSSLAFLCLLHASPSHATIFGRIGGVVHDPQHRPIAGASVVLRAANSNFAATAGSSADGTFSLPAVPLGEYTATVIAPGFAILEQRITVSSNTTATLHFELAIAAASETVTVTGESEAGGNTVTPTTLVSRLDIARTPGADRTNGLEMITDYVPGAYLTHNQLHMRGGHQVSWLIDGVQIPNTNIASNLGAQIDPKDIDYLEVQRGSYGADVGDRTYGVFNVVPRSGFERNRDAELVLSLGNFFQTNDQLNLGNHTERFAWYASLSGNRSDYGLAPPTAQVRHNAAHGYGGFGSLLWNRTAHDQLRTMLQLREDYFQIPYDPDPGSPGNAQYASYGLRDRQHETDGVADVTWAHTFRASTVLQVSPFVHYNRANYEPWTGDQPVATTSDRSSTYAGLQASVTGEIARHTLQAGVYSFGQRDRDLLSVLPSIGSASGDANLAPIRTNATGGVVEEFVSDSYKLRPWLRLIGGLRESTFVGNFTESHLSPRVGAALQVPRLHWVVRGFYGRFYQPPPLLTAAGPVLDFAQNANTTFQPLRGERDEEHQFGLQIPFRGWVLDADTFKTRANNFLDHSNIGASSLYFPVTVDGALIQAWELSLRSPLLLHRAHAHLAYSNQTAKQRGGLTGGLVCYPITSANCSTDFSYRPLDHDQRNTLSMGFDASLPRRSLASVNVNYGSGFTNGGYSVDAPPVDPRYTGRYLPEHTTVDLALSKSFGERATVSVSALNVANRRVLLDNSLTFGGFHVNDPRQLYGEVRWRFHF